MRRIGIQAQSGSFEFPPFGQDAAQERSRLRLLPPLAAETTDDTSVIQSAEVQRVNDLFALAQAGARAVADDEATTDEEAVRLLEVTQTIYEEVLTSTYTSNILAALVRIGATDEPMPTELQLAEELVHTASAIALEASIYAEVTDFRTHMDSMMDTLTGHEEEPSQIALLPRIGHTHTSD